MKNKNMTIILLCFLVLPSLFAYADIKCVRPTIGFFNGMLNTVREADNNFAALKNKLSDQNEIFTKFKMPFNYVLFYNNTNGISKDINEVFKQLKKEEDSGIILDPRTEKDYKNHEILAANALQKGMGLLLVGHSQGNFFLNHIYEYCRQNARSMPCIALHVGSPSNNNNGPYFLSNNDRIIQSFYTITRREFRPNITIPFSLTDATGHCFINTYLDKSKIIEEIGVLCSISVHLFKDF